MNGKSQPGSAPSVAAATAATATAATTSTSTVASAGTAAAAPATVSSMASFRMRQASEAAASIVQQPVDLLKEVNEYLSGTAVVDNDEYYNPLLWWRANQTRFPCLSVMARNILAIEATTIQAESCFSEARAILRYNRSRMASLTATALILTKSYLRAADRYHWRLHQAFKWS